ncbi:hypothetical protein QE152_g9654 [Popillia japonica]|uniref:Uncharacterized protein n=1 Tax=Popillia japonica TaxID=7064 RepID=A0AAW1LXQ2_POPJA
MKGSRVWIWLGLGYNVCVPSFYVSTYKKFCFNLFLKLLITTIGSEGYISLSSNVDSLHIGVAKSNLIPKSLSGSIDDLYRIS